MSAVGDRLIALAACLCQQINEEPDLPGVCFCGIIPGEAAVGQYAGDCDDECGMAWVRLGSSYPSDRLGTINENPGNCTAGLGIDVEMGIMRCFPIPEDGSAPSPEELTEVSNLQIMDMMVMWKAAMCCADLPNKEFRLTGYTPIGPAGDMIGGSWGIQLVM